MKDKHDKDTVDIFSQSSTEYETGRETIWGVSNSHHDYLENNSTHHEVKGDKTIYYFDDGSKIAVTNKYRKAPYNVTKTGEAL